MLTHFSARLKLILWVCLRSTHSSCANPQGERGVVHLSREQTQCYSPKGALTPISARIPPGAAQRGLHVPHAGEDLRVLQEKRDPDYYFKS